ncbi:hypothetical protein M8J77_017747 [Diaphorina citri]|nr:hypothetical protein M8J77_017747 [Diaphorina citri]
MSTNNTPPVTNSGTNVANNSTNQANIGTDVANSDTNLVNSGTIQANSGTNVANSGTNVASSNTNQANGTNAANSGSNVASSGTNQASSGTNAAKSGSNVANSGDSGLSSQEKLYSDGARVWLPHPDLEWQGAVVISGLKKGAPLKIRTESGEIKEIAVSNESDLPPLRNPDILIGENDLTSLSYLHEPAVLYNLQVRFCQHNAIYTYCGIVLVAINPYTELPIYGSNTIWTYRGKNMGDLDPHIFAVAEEAYTKMEREKKDQSIIVSGESGAGKTVSAKYAMRYFATVGGSQTETQVEKKVLASSPIMEAIGNAKTIRNDNSSRFGKFTELHFNKQYNIIGASMRTYHFAIGNAKTIRNDNSSRFGKFTELHFNKHYNIIGASMRTYLLEKSRVVFQAPNERNYHVFYQLCCARDKYPYLLLDEPDSFQYIRECCEIPGVNDEEGFEETQQAFVTLGFSALDQEVIFRILSSILHLGNIQFSGGSHGDTDSCSIAPSSGSLAAFCDILYNIDRDEFRRCLTHRKITTMQESFNKPMSVFEAENARDALAKHMYSCLFLHVVSKLNRNLSQSQPSNSNRNLSQSQSSASSNQGAAFQTTPPSRFIGVLDIYGFETFDSNNFEQFCINYANEKLQQQFNQHVFKLEQEEYLQEGIEWKFIDFYDNQPCIDLIESKLGILDLLDEECKMPKGSDTSWAEKLYTKCSDKWSKHFVKPRFGAGSFLVKHFADDVTYDTAGFLEKNRDTVYEEQIALLHSSTNTSQQSSTKTSASSLPSGAKILRSIFAPSESLSPTGGGGGYATVGHAGGAKRMAALAASKTATLPSSKSKQHKKTVGSQFRESLSLLMRTLNSTIPHYIRCIKPNDTKRAFEFNAHRTMQQLRACGVLETIRISAAGFPSRWTYGEFYNRYRVLCGNLKQYNTAVHSMNEIGEHIVTSSIAKAQFLAFLLFNHLPLQLSYLSPYQRKVLAKDCDKYKFGKTKIFFRSGQVAYLEKLRAEKLKRCCIVIQKNVRCFLVRKKYLSILKSVATLQRWTRGYMARRLVLHMRRTRAAVRIQSAVRAFIHRRQYLRLRALVLGLQCAARGMLVRREVRRVRQNRAALRIQTRVRGFLARRNYEATRAKIVICQASIRRFLAKKRFKKMKKEARRVEHVKKLNKGLENKIISMQQRIGDLTKESALLRTQNTELLEIKTKYEALRGADIELKKLTKAYQAREQEVLNLTQNLEIERLEKLDLINEREVERMELIAANEKLEGENLQLIEKIQSIADEMETSKINIENSIRNRVEAEKSILIREADETRDAYQRLLAEKNTLEARVENLERQLSARGATSLSASNVSPSISPSHTRTLSNTSTLSVNDAKSYQDVDINLVLKLTQRLKQLELEKDKLTKFVQEQTVTPSGKSLLRTKEAIKMAEVESENLRLRKDISMLRSEILNQNTNLQMEKFVGQLESLENELNRARTENADLRHVMLKENKMNFVTEDEQLLLAFETHKNIIRQLESEVDELKTRLMNDREKYLSEIQGLQDKNIKLSECLSKTYSTDVSHTQKLHKQQTSLNNRKNKSKGKQATN